MTTRSAAAVFEALPPLAEPARPAPRAVGAGRALALLALAACGAGCASTGEAEVLTAKAFIQGRAGFPIRGTALFSERDGVLHVVVDVVDAPPGPHGVHVHDALDCAVIDASGVGRHFNPDRTAHGDPRDPATSHAGDLGNLTVGFDRTGRLEFTTTRLSLAIGERDVVRRVITIAETADDFTTQPYGASGPAIACGVIRID